MRTVSRARRPSPPRPPPDVAWLRRRDNTSEQDPSREGEGRPGAVERAAPGLSALFDGLRREDDHSVLDLASGSAGNLRFYSRFARRIRFADLVGPTTPFGSWTDALRSIPGDRDHPYDVVLAWNLLDRLEGELRVAAVDRILDVTAPGARLYVLTDLARERAVQPLQFSLLDNGRVAQEPVGVPQPAGPVIMPAELDRLLHPFRVEHSFVLRIRMREYVAVRS